MGDGVRLRVELTIGERAVAGNERHGVRPGRCLVLHQAIGGTLGHRPVRIVQRADARLFLGGNESHLAQGVALRELAAHDQRHVQQALDGVGAVLGRVVRAVDDGLVAFHK